MDYKINIRMDKELYFAITDLSKQYNKTKSSIIRDILKTESVNFKFNNLSKNDYNKLISEIHFLKTELGKLETMHLKVGNNLNQVAKRLNKNEIFYIDDDFKEFNMEFKKISTRLEFLSKQVGDLFDSY